VALEFRELIERGLGAHHWSIICGRCHGVVVADGESVWRWRGASARRKERIVG